MWTWHLSLTLQGSAAMLVGQCKRNHTSSSLRFLIRGPRHRQLRSTLYKPMCGPEQCYIIEHVQKEKTRKQSQDKKPLPKGDNEGVTIHSPQNTHSGQVSPSQPLLGVVGEPCIGPTCTVSKGNLIAGN